MKLPDDSIISVSIHCTRLQSLYLGRSDKITDASIISISTYCIGLQELNLGSCRQITDSSIISISTYCTGLQSLNLQGCYQLTDANINSISTHCTGLQTFNLSSCDQITDASIKNNWSEIQNIGTVQFIINEHVCTETDMYVPIHTSIYYCCIFQVMISHMVSIDPAPKLDKQKQVSTVCYPP